MAAGANLVIDGDRLVSRLNALAQIGATPDGGVRRLAFSAEDKQGRDWLVAEMRAVGLTVEIDRIGNIFGTLPAGEGAPVMSGSHIDTVATGGRYDGALGVIAALEAAQVLKESGVALTRPFTVAAFSNEEGARFQPDMMGSCVHAGVLSLDAAFAARDAAGMSVGQEIAAHACAGEMEPGTIRPHAFVELHIEQGPILDAEGRGFGIVEGVQGIRWFELTLTGEPNHAGTTPLSYRRDAGLVAARIIAFARETALSIEGTVATAGRIVFEPGQVNVVPGRALFTLDLRNPDDSRLDEVERRVMAFAREAAAAERVEMVVRKLARFPAVAFDADVIAALDRSARSFGHEPRRMVSGAGHDAQIMAGIAPAAMVFVPSVKGLSHNPAEFTADEDLIAGANVLLRAVLRLAQA
jgi:N-carbamoyl-L-amino-acid hydrolase